MRRDYVATILSVGYDDLQPIARGIRPRVEPVFVLDASPQSLVRSLDSPQNLLIATVDLRMALDDVAPALVGQLNASTIGIANHATIFSFLKAHPLVYSDSGAAHGTC